MNMNEYLARLGWSQAFFAEHIGRSKNTVCKWCNGEPDKLAMLYLKLLVKQIEV